MSLTCFPTENIYLNHTNTNNHEQTNPNSNLLNSTSNQFRNKLINNQSADNLNLSTTAPVNHPNLTNNSNVNQNSKSDLMISGFDSFPLSRTTTPIPYLTNSSLDGYFSTTLGTPNPQLNNQLNSHLNRCHSSNSNCSTNSKLNNSSLISSRPASSFDNFLIINNDSDDSTQANSNHTNQSATSNQSHTVPVVSYYPHTNFNNNSANDALNSQQQQQSNATSTTHHSSNFHSSNQGQVKKEYLDQANYSNAINFNNNNNDVQMLSNSSSNLNSSLNDNNNQNRMQMDDNEPQSTSKTNGLTSKKRRNKVNGGQPSRPQCTECGKDFSNQSALSKHKLTHSDERKFVCPLCSKGFKRNDHLNGHLYTHREKKPYQCDISNCEKTYCDARSLKRHKENHHSIFSQLALPLLGKGLPADLASNLLSAVKTTDGNRIKYAPSSNENSNNHELADLDLNNAFIDTNLIDLSDKSQSALIQQLINEDNGSTALSILQQRLAEQQSNYVECPTCQKKFKNLPALNGHMRLHGGFYRGGNQQLNNENSNQRSNATQALPADQSINDGKNDQLSDSPIDLIKKESLFVDLTNQNNQQQSIQSQPNPNSTDLNSNIIKEKIRKHIANIPVITENPEANRFQQPQQQIINDNNGRVHYYSQNDSSQNNNLLSTSVISNNNPYSTTNKSPLVDHQQLQLDNHSSPNDKLIQQNEQDILNNNQEKQVVHENSWFEDPNNVLHLKEQLQQQFRTPVSTKIINQQHQLKPNNLTNRPAAIPSHVFTNGEKFRRHSDSTAEILNQNMNQPNYVNNHHHQNNNSAQLNQQIHSQNMNPNLHQQETQMQPMNYETNNLNSQIKNNNDLLNFDYLKRKMPQHRVENETNIETMETIPESQIINSTSNTNYLSSSNHLQANNNHHVSFYNNCNNSGGNQQLAYQSHSVPTTPTVNQNFFSNQRIDLNRVNQQLNHDYSQINNGNNQIHHSNQNLSVNNQQQHSLPCTPKQPTSFTFSPHQVQHYQQQNQTSYHNNQYNSSPNTPITPVTPTTNCGNQYQDSLIMQRSNLHPQQQNNQLTVEYNNNTICSRDKFTTVNQQQNINSYNNMINNQYLDSNDNLNNVDHLNNNAYPSIINDNYLVNENNTGYNESQQHDQQAQFLNCQISNNYQVNNVICSNNTNTNTNRTNYPQQLSNVSNVIISNYATTNDEDVFCENNLMSTENLNKDDLDDLNASLNDNNNDKQVVVNSCQQPQQPQHQQTPTNEITPEKYTRVTLRSNSPNLIIETDSYKNSTADDSQQPFSNLNEDPEDDVFLAPTSPAIRSISSPKTNFAYKKPKSSTHLTASNNFLGRVNSLSPYSSSSMNHSLPQVDFTHPQQPKSTANKISSFNLNKKDELKKQHCIEEDQLNDINFNSIKMANNNTVYSNLNKTRINDKQIVDRNSSPKRKHRPEPLYIPPHVNARSKTANAHYRVLPSSLIDNNPPPYTPPPMLSPVRTNSSYYYYILSGNLTPKTMANFFSNRTGKSLEQQQSAITNNQTNMLLNSKNRSFDFFSSANQNDISTPATAYEPLDSCLPDVEPTFDFSSYLSTNAHVNVGTAYQARIPTFNPNKEEAKLHYKNEKADKVWDPQILDNLTFSSNNNDEFRQFRSATGSKKKVNQTKKDLDLYLDLSCSACIVGAGRNKEYAYHVLHQNKGDLNKSIKELLNPQPFIKPDHPLYNYKYAETDIWTSEEIKSYYEALLKYDKDFLSISKQVENKSVKQCIEFYYLWKKVCQEEYKKHRQLRRKKEHEGIISAKC